MISLVALYHLLAPFYSTPKQLSWILTSISSAGMTIASLPFIWDYLASAGDVQSVRTLPLFSFTANRFFQAYLTADLMMGAIYYPAQLTLLTGWIHHVLYLFIVELAIRHSWTHIFCLCALMELPTFVLGITSLYPHLRSNVIFAVTFASTRIVLHAILCISYLLPKNHASTHGSWVPSIILACVFPLHAFWFRGCINGFIKRARAGNPSPVVLPKVPMSTAISDKDVSSNSPSHSHTSSSMYKETCSQLPITQISLAHSRGRLFKRAMRKQVDLAMQRLAEARRGLHGSLPRRDVIFEFVGLSSSVGVPWKESKGQCVSN